MIERAELLVNLWTYGAPVVLMVWAALRLTARADARFRYGIAVAGFVATLAVPLASPIRWTPESPSASLTSTANAAHPEGLALPRNVGRGVTWTWLLVGAALLIRDLVGHARLRRRRRAFPAASPALKSALQWPASVPLVTGEHPCTIGLFRPAVVLPADLRERFSAEVARSIAGHELSHARWRDPLVYALLRAAAAVFWVSPAWIALRWVRREREAAADAAALRDAAGVEETYVEALLRLATLRPERALGAAMAASDLEYRARCILSRPRLSKSAVLALAGGWVLLACATPATFHSDEPEVVRKVARTVTVPEPVRTVRVVPSSDEPRPRRREATSTTDAIQNAIEERVDEAMLPVTRDLSSLSTPPELIVEEDAAEDSTHVDVHVDADEHVHVDEHADAAPRVVDRRIPEKDDERIRIVIRNRT